MLVWLFNSFAKTANFTVQMENTENGSPTRLHEIMFSTTNEKKKKEKYLKKYLTKVNSF